MILNIKKYSEHKSNVVQRLLYSTFKFIEENIIDQPKSSNDPFSYEIPASFIKAVDNARVQAGYDILPRHRKRSVSPLSNRSSRSSSISSQHLYEDMKSTPKIYQTSSLNDLEKVSKKKIPFRRTPRQHEQQRKPVMKPRLFSTEPPVRMMMNPPLMMANRFQRPRNFIQIRPRMFIQPRQMIRMRLR